MSEINAVVSREQFFEDVFVNHGKVHKIYSALGRYPTIWGCDRELFIFNAMLSIGVIVLTVDLMASIISLGLGLLVFLLLFKMGEADPLMRYVYLRQLRYRRYYAAQGFMRSPAGKDYQHFLGWL